MAETSYPWAGMTTDGAPGDAGPYSFQDWARRARALAAPGAFRPNAGVLFGSDSLDLSRRGLEVIASSPAAATVDVRPGSALVQGIGYFNNAVETLAIAANGSGNPRIDTVVLRMSATAQTIRLAVLTGTAAGSPVAAALTQITDGIWEIPVAYVAVANGFTTITDAEISQVAEPANGADGVYLYGILNNSGGELKTGDVVIWDASADQAVTTTTTLSDPQAAGVWVGVTPDGGYGRVLKSGVGLVRVAGAVARGTALVSSATAKAAGAHTGPTVTSVDTGSGLLDVKNAWRNRKHIGTTLEAASGAGLVLALIDVDDKNPGQEVQEFATIAAMTLSAHGAWTNVHSTYLNISMTTLGGDVEIEMSAADVLLGTAGDAVALYFDVLIDGTTRASTILGVTSTGVPSSLRSHSRNIAGNTYLGFKVRIPLAAGAHTFRLQYYLDGTSGTNTLGNNRNFTVRELP